MYQQQKEGEEKDTEMEEAISQAIRGSEMDLLQGLVAQTLASAIFAYDQLYKVRQTIEAFLLLDGEKQEELIPDENERARLKRAHEIADSFMAMQTWVEPFFSVKLALIPWSFAPKESKLYFSDFARTVWQPSNEDGSGKYSFESEEEYFNWFYSITLNGAPIHMCLSVREQFIDSVLPTVLKLIREIHQKFIQPEVWERAIMAFAGKHGGGSKHGDLGPLED